MWTLQRSNKEPDKKWRLNKESKYASLLRSGHSKKNKENEVRDTVINYRTLDRLHDRMMDRFIDPRADPRLLSDPRFDPRFVDPRVVDPRVLGSRVGESRLFGLLDSRSDPRLDARLMELDQEVEEGVESLGKQRFEPEFIRPRMEPEYMRPRVEHEFRPRMEPDIKPRIEEEFKSRMEPDFKSRMEPDYKSKIEPELKPRMEPDPKSRTDPDFKPRVDTELKLRTESRIEGRSEPSVRDSGPREPSRDRAGDLRERLERMEARLARKEPEGRERYVERYLEQVAREQEQDRSVCTLFISSSRRVPLAATPEEFFDRLL
ncbi:UPF0430 protein CG31712-like [Procambarus clarkii]|uniref:UPF0430 protein CG31712-like n=1 Tax=Procambarus clarkii TaxID=6728 RepID=UPI003742CEB5